MMNFAQIEETAREAWEKQLDGAPRNAEHERIPFQLFHAGFVAGAAWRDKLPIFLGVDLSGKNVSDCPLPDAEGE